MTRVVGAVVGVTALALLVFASPISAQSPTGVVKTLKLSDVLDEAGLPTTTEWTTWTVDDIVTRLVHEPVKSIGLRRFQAEGRVGVLKRQIALAEARTRAVAVALAEGRLEPDEAHAAIEVILLEYHGELAELAHPR